MGHIYARFDAMVLRDSIIVTSGVIADSIPGYFRKNQLGFFDLNGNLLYWTKFRGDSATNYGTFYNSLISTRDGGFAVTGYTEKANTPMQALFMKFDSVGEVMFVREYDVNDTTNKFLNAETLIELPDGYLIGGDRTTITPALYNANIHLIKIDTVGNVQWWKSYGTVKSDIDVSLLYLNDTSYLIGYTKNNWFLGEKWEWNETHLMIIDTAGIVKHDWLDPYDSCSAPYSLLRTKDGGFAYCGRLKHSQPLPYQDVLFQGGVTKLDSAFNIQWRKRLGFPNPVTSFYQLKELQDGSFVTVGSHFWGDDTSARYTGWFVKLSANGDSIWDRKYQCIAGNNSQSHVYDFEMLSDGGIIACGESRYPGQQGWLIRLDSMGCLIPGCDTITFSAIKGTPNDLFGMQLFPSPAKEMVHILLKGDEQQHHLSLTVYSSEGKQVITQSHITTDVTYMLNISNYSPGIYIVEVKPQTGEAVYRKFVKE